MESNMNDADAFRYPRVLTIAGSDSGGGAGIQADLKTMAALGCYGMSAITAITAQNTLGVTAIHGVPTDVLGAQIDAVVSDIGVDAVKIGMLHSAAVMREVARAIDRHRLPNVVLDPVMIATSGARLIDDDAIGVLVETLLPRAVVVTPNLDEAAVLASTNIPGAAQVPEAAEAIRQLGAAAVLLKGGHLPGAEVVDLLLQASGPTVWRSPRIETRNLHGTGCTLSSAIACHLALGLDLNNAVAAARDYVHNAIRAGAAARIGGGHGPLNHGESPRPLLRVRLNSAVASNRGD